MVAPENVVFEAQFNIFYFMEKSHSVLEISIFLYFKPIRQLRKL